MSVRNQNFLTRSHNLDITGVWGILGPLGPLGALGPIGPLGPVGAHGYRAGIQHKRQYSL